MFFDEIFYQYLEYTKKKYTIKYRKKLDSTNQYAYHLIDKNVKDRTIIITKNQTNGKGQRSNKWFSSKNKSLTFSLIIKTNQKYDELLSFKIGIALIEAIKKNSGISCKLKWPNDIIIERKKIGGVLIEKKKNNLVIGVGINVNESEQDINPIIRSESVSLKILTNISTQLEHLLANILNEFEKYYYQTNLQKIIQKWEENCCHINK